MNIEIKNSCLTIQLHTMGGELQSIRSYADGEYLWQGDARYWSDRAPNLFPYVARLTEGKYRYGGKEYEMGIHGFIKDCDMEVIEKREDMVTLKVSADPVTKKQYPFEFEYYISYILRGKKLSIQYRVVNTGNKKMYFGLGGHPGFAVPLEPAMKFEDYYLEFENKCSPVRIGFTEDCFLNGEEKMYHLEANRIYLRHELFDKDAIVLTNMSKSVCLKSGRGKKSVRISYPDMKYLGLWHHPKTNAPYVCIEPWTSLPSRKNVIEDISLQKDLIGLGRGQEYYNSWEIECQA